MTYLCTDKDILKDLIDREGVKTTIFYHDKQQQTQQIANLVKMLGQEHFIKMINSVPQQITFVQQQELIFTAQHEKGLLQNKTAIATYTNK